MDYYQRKTGAMNLIDKLTKTGICTKDDICFEVLRKYSLGEKFTLKYIERLTEREMIKEENGKVISA